MYSVWLASLSQTDYFQPREMAHIVNTNVATVKMSGSFATPDFSSSEEEGEEKETFVRRPRSNAVSESHVTTNSPPVKTKTPPTSQKDSESLSHSEQKILSNSVTNSSHSTNGLSMSSSSSETETGSPEQRGDTDDPDSCNTSSALVSEPKTVNSSQPRSDEDATLTGPADRNCDVDSTTLNPVQGNSTSSSSRPISNGGSQISSPEIMSSSSTSSPVMVNRTSAHGITTSNGALSSATTSASSGSSLRDMYYQSR